MLLADTDPDTAGEGARGGPGRAHRALFSQMVCACGIISTLLTGRRYRRRLGPLPPLLRTPESIHNTHTHSHTHTVSLSLSLFLRHSVASRHNSIATRSPDTWLIRRARALLSNAPHLHGARPTLPLNIINMSLFINSRVYCMRRCTVA